jgi:hypothetical protein
MSHGCVRRFLAAIVATHLALAFLAVCLGSCLAPAEAHACCQSKAPAITAETGGCFLHTDGVSVTAIDLPADGSGAVVVLTALPTLPVAHPDAPSVAASPPRILRI